MGRTITIGTRGSDLALIQAALVEQALLRADKDLQISIKVISTEGDQNSSPIPLDVVGKGWFTKEIEEELLDASIDLAVHSLKDMPEVLPLGTHIAAYLEREDPRDALVSNNNLELHQLPQGARVGTDSIRRKIQILALRSDLNVLSMRGNVPTRLKKLQSGAYDAVILAAAGLKRLGMADQVVHYFDINDMMPAPGQGVLAVEARLGDHALTEVLMRINHLESAAAAIAERTFAAKVGGGCKNPTGAYAHAEGKELVLQGMVASDDGLQITKDSAVGPLEQASQIGENLGTRMLAKHHAT